MGEQSYNAVTEFVDANVASGRAGKVAFRDRTRELTFGEVQERSCRAAAALTGLGLRPEERVLLLMQDTVDFPVVFWGAIRAGIAPVPLNTLLAADQYRYILGDSRAQAVVVSAPLLPVLRDALAGSPGDPIVIVAGADGGEYLSLDAVLEAADHDSATYDASPDGVAFWLYSSGSTGMPKGVKHVHSSLAETARLYGKGVLNLGEDDVVFSAAKFFFAYGLGNSLTFPMAAGATAVLLDERPTPASVFEVLHREQPTIFFGVPTLYAAILADPACTREAGSQRLRLCISAGEALPEHIGRTWEERFGVEIIDGLGSTEMLHIFISNRPGSPRYGTSGLTVEGYETRLVGDSGEEVADGEIGELLVSGPTAAEGYWNQRAKSRTTFEGGWTRTGDKYTRDAEGYYTYAGRTDDMFKVSGIWLSPFEVESALASHPAVLEAAVVPGADADGLLKPRAFVVLKDPAAASDGLDQELKDHVKNAIGLWKYPRWIEHVESLPKTATGKIQRFKLRERE